MVKLFFRLVKNGQNGGQKNIFKNIFKMVKNILKNAGQNGQKWSNSAHVRGVSTAW
jgi:hypothetical protein